MTAEKLAAILGKELETETRVEGESVFFSYAGLELIAKNLDAGIVRIFSVVIDEDMPGSVPDEAILRMLNGIEKEVACAKCVFLDRDDTGVYYRLCVEFHVDGKGVVGVKGYCKAMVDAMMKFAAGLYKISG